MSDIYNIKMALLEYFRDSPYPDVSASGAMAAIFPYLSQPEGVSLTLRDHFAGQQLAAYRAHPGNIPARALNCVAEYCYAMADAMMEAREV